MREGLFIKKNKERWERVQQQAPVSPDELARDFSQLVDDLAYAKTFYPKSKVTQYINALASGIYLSIYRNRKEENNRLVRFWTREVPLVIRKHHGAIAIAFVIFCLFFLVGFFSAVSEPLFVREVLGDRYVDVTERNIEQGNPFGIFKAENSLVMWIRIMVNNIMVSFIYFFKGIAFGVTSITALGKESIRLGAFEYMFFARGLGKQAIITVLIHGMLELTAIIIACASGMVMGTSYLFVKTTSRLDAFRQGTKDGVKMVIGLIPIFVIAAFFESFVTRHDKMPLLLNIGFLMLSAVFIIWYFIVYPIKIARNLFTKQAHTGG